MQAYAIERKHEISYRELPAMASESRMQCICTLHTVFAFNLPLHFFHLDSLKMQCTRNDVMVFEMIGRYSGKFYSKSKVCLTFQVMICNAYKLELVANTAHVTIFIRF